MVCCSSTEKPLQDTGLIQNPEMRPEGWLAASEFIDAFGTDIGKRSTADLDIPLLNSLLTEC
ncbi:hypothetical protein ACKWRH_45375 (plasmid) [Bradyrhizobium sp. Pa8]|uniref:hypothetical protein n=1 Tax=Bradyrhizobium sp. Pa8 TaxID=3386552 RepID=UPI00403FBCFA